MLLVRSSIVGAVALLALPASAADKPAPNSGQTIYDRDCATCHGETGKGDGDTAEYLTPKPEDFTSGILGKRSDEFLTAVIAGGGPAKGLSASMPGFAKLSKTDLKSVVAYVRQLGKGAGGKKSK
jgi:mono/diheme cytochrome c family protein